jgi:hypothetical protein
VRRRQQAGVGPDVTRGAGVGPLVSGLLLPVIPPDLLYAGTAVFLAISAVAMLGVEKR